MLKTLALAIGVLIAAVLIYATTRPDSFSLQRSATIKAPAEKVFALINDFHNWEAWSPWEKLDPAMKRTFSGPAQGAGAGYAWVGNSKVGEGSMQIMNSMPVTTVNIKLDFIKPFEGHNFTEFSLQPRGDSTEVTWSMNGPAPFITKLMTVFVSMDKLVGKDFEAGLANLKAAAEK